MYITAHAKLKSLKKSFVTIVELIDEGEISHCFLSIIPGDCQPKTVLCNELMKSHSCFTKGQQEAHSADRCWALTALFHQLCILEHFISSLPWLPLPIYKADMIISSIHSPLKFCHLVIINDYDAAPAANDSKNDLVYTETLIMHQQTIVCACHFLNHL